MKLTRNSKIFINYFLGPLLFCWLFWSIYQQIAHQPGLKQAWEQILYSWNTEKLLLLAASLVLMFINWALEAYKWKIAIEPVQKVSFLNSIQAIFAGVSFSVTTPNRVGEYFGRLMYVKEGSRLRTISVSIVGSMSQLIITLLFGLIGLLVLRPLIIQDGMVNETWMQVLLSGVSLVLLGLLLFYFRLRWILHLLSRPALKKLFYLVEALEQLDTKILVFGLQYYLFFYLFEVDLTLIDSFWAVNVSFLVMAVIPTIAIAELAQRGKVIITLAGLYSSNHLGITLATAAVWLINLILPALIGSLLILRKRKIVTA